MMDARVTFESMLRTGLPDGLAVIDHDIRLSRAEFFAIANSRADAITEAVPPDTRIAFVDTEDHQAILNIIASLLAGRSIAMLPTKPDDDLQHVAARARCSMIARGSALENVAIRLSDDPRLDPGFGTALANSPEAVVLHTSGTTKEPRGVRLTRRNVVSNLTAMMRISGKWRPDDRLGLTLALTHSFGLSMSLLALAQGAPIVMVGGGIPGRATAEVVTAEEVTVLGAVPYFLKLLAKRGLPLGSAKFAPGLKTLFLAGGGITDQELDTVAPDLRATTFLMYGFTEATARVAVRRRGDGAPSGSVGLPLPGTSVDVVEPGGSPLPIGASGRIRVNSPGLLLGFLGADPLPPGEPFETNDLGWVDEAGNLFIEGREAEMLNFRGNRVSLIEQEARLGTVAGIQEGRVVPDSSEEDAQCVLNIVAVDGFDRREVKWAAINAVEPRGLVREVVFVDHLETTRSGKPIRRSSNSHNR